MGAFLNTRPASAGRQPRAIRAALAAMALLAIAFSLAAPVARASLNDELKNLPPDASPKETCHILIKGGAVKARQEGPCREMIAEGFKAAKKKTSDSQKTIASAAICTIDALEGKIKKHEVSGCSEKVAETLSMGGGFDPIGAAGEFVSGVAGAVGGAISGAINDTIVSGFKAIIGLLFGGLQAAITVALIKWITTIPDLSGGHVGNLEGSIAIGAGGLLAATMTISIVRFWGSGLTGDGAWAGAEGVLRGATAAALIGLWPSIFGLAVKLANALQTGILSGGVQGQLKALFKDLDVIGLAGGALTGGVIPMILAIIIAVVGLVMLLSLVAMKIVITALTIVLFCAMPLALVVWPIPEMAGITRFCARTLGAALAVPVVWCLVFGSFAAIGADTFSFSNTGKNEGFMGTMLNVTVVRPLVAIALLYLALVLPKRLLHVVPFFNSRPGAIRHIGTGMAVRAGFSYAPQAGRMALGQLQSAGGAVGRLTGRWGGAGAAAGGAAAGASGEPTFRGRQEGKGGAARPTTTPGGRPRPEHASHPAPEKPGSEAKAGGAGSSGQAGGQSGERGQGVRSRQTSASNGEKIGYAAKSDQQHEKEMPRATGEFGGPRTMNPSEAGRQEVLKRKADMMADSAVGSSVSRQQVDGAAANLNSRPDLLESARKAAFSNSPEDAAGAFAEWSLTDNPHVSDTHRSAFEILGSASQGQRKTALGVPGSGPVGGGGSGSGPGQPAGGGSRGSNGNGSNGNGSNGRRVPPVEFQTHEPPARRTPHPQPGPGGGS